MPLGHCPMDENPQMVILLLHLFLPKLIFFLWWVVLCYIILYYITLCHIMLS